MKLNSNTNKEWNICEICKKKYSVLSNYLGICRGCIINQTALSLEIALEKHNFIRNKFNQSPILKAKSSGLICGLCGNKCQIAESEIGFCGLIKNDGNRLIRLAGTSDKGLLSSYYDPLPTNCVADWVCPAGTGCGYPKYTHKDGPEYGYNNLAVFYKSCNFNCLFCQNWHYRTNPLESKFESAENLARKVDDKVSCICYFGGDPGTQITHSLKTSEIALEKANKSNRLLRICWETNGNMNEKLLDKALNIALKSGGIIKFDLKTFNESLNVSLCGRSNRATLKNFQRVAKRFSERPEIPLIVASTLLIPGYINQEEISAIAGFISDLNPNIPYKLLAFHPNFYMSDLPRTSRDHALKCYNAAVSAGCKKVEIGNINLLSNNKY